MMDRKEDLLGLSLSLSFPQNPPQLKLMPSISPSNHTKTSWIDNFPSFDRRSETCRDETRSFLKGIDVKRPLPTVDVKDEAAGVSSPNSTVSSVSGKRSERDENDNERACSRGISDEEDGENCRKKLRLSKDQSAVLEDSFKEHNTLNPVRRLALAKLLGLKARQVEVWFQNRRARTKLKQIEVDCEFLKCCCENLSEENRRLHKEVQELRALKVSPQFYMQMAPPTILTVCPSCERVALPTATPVDSPWPHQVGGGTAHHQPVPGPPAPHPSHTTRSMPSAVDHNSLVDPRA